MSNLDTIFKVPLSRGGLIPLLLFSLALNTEFRVHWKGGLPWSAWTGLKWSPGLMNSFFNTLIKLYYTKALSTQALSLAPDRIPLLRRPRILVSFMAQSNNLSCPWYLSRNAESGQVFLMSNCLLTLWYTQCTRNQQENLSQNAQKASTFNPMALC